MIKQGHEILKTRTIVQTRVLYSMNKIKDKVSKKYRHIPDLSKIRIEVRVAQVRKGPLSPENSSLCILLDKFYKI